MSHIVHIRRNSDGLIRQYRRDCDWEDDGGSRWLWTDGNYSCDCNRYLFFQRAAGDPEDDDIVCGDLAYSVLGAELPDGRCVPIDMYKDIDW